MRADEQVEKPQSVVRLEVEARVDPLYVRFWFVADLLAASVIVAFWAVLLFWVDRMRGVLRPPEPTFVQTALGVAGLFLAGVIAFAFRLWLRRIYEMAEVLFALVVAWSSIAAAHQLSPFQVMIGGVSAVYLVVRGLDNWLQGVEARDGGRR